MATLETYLYITAVCEIKLLSEEKHNSKSHYEKKKAFLSIWKWKVIELVCWCTHLELLLLLLLLKMQNLQDFNNKLIECLCVCECV